MKTIRLIEPRGFCFGVRNALNIVEQVLNENPDRTIYIYNEIVHNKLIVTDLKKRGVIFTQDTSSIPDSEIVIISAHGIAPAIRKDLTSRGRKVIDATCPLVEKVHKEVISYSQKGYHIIYIGDPKHDEAKGVIAEAQHNISVVQTETDILNIKKGFKKYIVLNQTTLNMFDVSELITKIRQTIPQLETPAKNDICFATTSRQNAVLEHSSKCELVIVLGSKNSSNSQKLKKIAQNAGAKSILIDSVTELHEEILAGISNVCITAGASAPEYLVQELKNYLKSKDYQLLGNN